MDLTVVAHQLRSPDNLGAIARVMANFGFSRLVLADPVTHDFRGAERLAVHAEEIVRGLSVAATLEESLKDVVFAVASTSRSDFKRQSTVSPEEGAGLLQEHSARGRVALVLGGEKRGLKDEELNLCQAVVVIPTAGAQPSMNVAQATAVLLHACAARNPPAEAAKVSGARMETVRALEKKMETALLQCGFLNPQAPEHVLRELSRSLIHGQLTQREAELWLSAFEHVRRVTASVAPTGG